ncbi:PE family protein, partial [Mycobacterium sp. E3198]|uniref:PE family protein n=1 Tax=Mycobacterium sp. E3198 TaxID=1834143 RepID=UPI0012EA1E70
MSFVLAVPDVMADAATRLASIGSAISAAQAAAAAPTTGVLAAAGDEVSRAVAAVFSGYAAAYQALGAQAASLHARMVQALNASAGAYLGADAANASPLQTLQDDVLGLINAPTNALFGRPLIGDGANGTTNAQGIGTPGGAGGFLAGNGGNGGNSTAVGAPGGAGGPAGLWVAVGNGGA